MSGLLSHPLLTNDFQRELPIAGSKDSELKAKAPPALDWVVQHNAKTLLFKSLARCTHFKPTTGAEGKPSHWTSPPPGGTDQCVVVLLGLDRSAKLRAYASNSIPKPVRTDLPCPTEFFAEFEALRSTPSQIKLLHQAVSSVASKEHMDWVERIYKEGQRYRTSPIFLIVLDGSKQHFYATTALVEGPQQTDRTLEWTGRIAA